MPAVVSILYHIDAMPNYVRWREEGASYFFTVVTYRRRRLFHRSVARLILRQALVETRRERPFDMFACVLLPDHLHCIWTLPAGDEDFPVRWANVKRLFTKGYLAAGGVELLVTENRRKHRERGIWQPRYWEHRIRDEEDWYRHRDYIHLNPVKHGLAEDPKAWPWSSIHRHIRLGWLDPGWPGQLPDDLPDVPGE
ncbi:MAG TPA: transposase [Phycisphaerae bacterium]|nr:transposase [Phycisphaerae bacterium]